MLIVELCFLQKTSVAVFVKQRSVRMRTNFENAHWILNNVKNWKKRHAIISPWGYHIGLQRGDKYCVSPKAVLNLVDHGIYPEYMNPYARLKFIDGDRFNWEISNLKWKSYRILKPSRASEDKDCFPTKFGVRFTHRYTKEVLNFKNLIRAQEYFGYLAVSSLYLKLFQWEWIVERHKDIIRKKSIGCAECVICVAKRCCVCCKCCGYKL